MAEQLSHSVSHGCAEPNVSGGVTTLLRLELLKLVKSRLVAHCVNWKCQHFLHGLQAWSDWDLLCVW